MLARLFHRFPIFTRPKAAERIDEVSKMKTNADPKPATGVTVQQLNAAVDAIGVALAQCIEAARDQHFSAPRFGERLDEIAAKSPPAVRGFLKRIGVAMNDAPSYRTLGGNGRNRAAPWQPGGNSF